MWAQEQMGAIGQLGGVLGQGIATDNQHSQWNAGQLNQHQIEQLRAIGIHNQQQLNALTSAMGGTPAPMPGMGTQLMAGGANAMIPGLQYHQAQQERARQGQGGAPTPMMGAGPMGPQPGSISGLGQPGWYGVGQPGATDSFSFGGSPEWPSNPFNPGLPSW
jgi:hypothetical protein